MSVDDQLAEAGDSVAAIDRQSLTGWMGGAIAGLKRSLFAEPVVVVLLVVWTIFAIAHERFLSPVNLTNLALQAVAVGTISLGVVLVLLLGEIDLSVAAVSGLAGAVLASLAVKHGWPAPAAVAAALGTGAAIGCVQGTISTRLGVPSFVVTLAGLLAWKGFLLLVLGETGTININSPAIIDLTATFLSAQLGWLLGVLVIATIAARAWWIRRQRRRAQLTLLPQWQACANLVVIATLIFTAIAVANADRGVPLALLIFLALAAILSAICRSTPFGRRIYAVGGNAEAARRAGIRVTQVRVCVFALAGLLAAAGGVLAASRLLAVNQSSGSGDLLLFAIAGPVIAGVSLFGGRGRIWIAALGVLVVASISNGLDLLALASSLKFIFCGLVLLAAVSLDAVTRRRITQTVAR